MNSSSRSLALLVLSLVVMTMSMCVLLVGCSTSSAGPEIVLPGFRIRLAPEDVLYNFELAYNRMDVDELLDCMSEDFVFYPTEEDANDPTIPASWYKDTEEDIHTNMFDPASGVESIELTLTPTDIDTMPGQLPGDPSDDVVIYTVGVDLTVDLVGGLTMLATKPSEFRLRLDEDQTGPTGQDLWELFEWYELEDDGRAAAPKEDSSWGSIKAMFREEWSSNNTKSMFR